MKRDSKVVNYDWKIYEHEKDEAKQRRGGVVQLIAHHSELEV